METLKYTKVRNVKSPCRAHEFDAGIDFFVPSDLTLDDMKPKFETTGDYLLTEHNEDGTIKSFTLHPNQSVLIPSGIKVKVPEGYMLQFANKSGVASKRHLFVGACVSGTTIIETNKGKFTASSLTKEFCDKNNILVRTYDIKNHTYTYKKCDGFRIASNSSKIIRIEFDNGESIEGDENHLIYFNNKWQTLKDI